MLSPIQAQGDPLSVREKLLNAAAAALAILVLGIFFELFSHEGFALPLMASLGASAYLLFVVPHSPMAQPWPLVAGHMFAALVALACIYVIGSPILAAAAGVGGSVLAMQFLRCLHPPAAATALAVALSDLQGTGAFLIVVSAVAAGVLTLLLLAVAVNNLLLGRRYPMKHSHHPHHEQFQEAHAEDPVRLEESDIDWARGQMDGIVDVTTEDLIDIYELALDRAISRSGTGTVGGRVYRIARHESES